MNYETKDGDRSNYIIIVVMWRGIVMNEFDLHMHSCYSGDGQFTPEELIGIAKEI